VVLNTAFGQPTIAVDTHIYRVANRTAIASGKTVLEVEKKLIKFIPDDFKVPAHHLMILHGRYVCKLALRIVLIVLYLTCVNTKRKTYSNMTTQCVFSR